MKYRSLHMCGIVGGLTLSHPPPPLPPSCSYGPFWICTTLIVLVAVAGNFSSYISYRMDQGSSTPSPSTNGTMYPPPSSSTTGFNSQWFADYTKVGGWVGGLPPSCTHLWARHPDTCTCTLPWAFAKVAYDPGRLR